MRNGFLSKHIFPLSLLGLLGMIFTFQKSFAENKTIELPQPIALNKFIQENPDSNLQLVLEIDRLESKQDQAFVTLLKKIQDLPDSFSATQEITALQQSFLRDMYSTINTHQHPYIRIEGYRLYADFLVRLSLASLPDEKLAENITYHAQAYLNMTYEELSKYGAAWIEREMPQVLSRYAVTSLSLLNIKRLLNDQMTTPQFLSESKKIIQKVLELRPGPVSEAEILTAQVESFLFSQKSGNFHTYNRFYMTPDNINYFKETIERLKVLDRSLEQSKSGGLRRLLALEKIKTVLNISSFYLGGPAAVAGAIENLSKELQSTRAMQRRSARDALQYLYSVQELTGLSLSLSRLLGKESEQRKLIQDFENDFKSQIGHEFYSKIRLPSFDKIFNVLDPQANQAGHIVSLFLMTYLSDLHALSQKFVDHQAKKGVTSEQLENQMRKADYAWARMQCAFVYYGIDSFDGDYKPKSPLSKKKFDLNICLASEVQNKTLNGVSTNLIRNQIDKEKNIEVTLIAAGFTFDVALAILTVGTGNLVKKGLQKAATTTYKSITRKLVVSATGRFAMKATQKLALAVTTDVIVSTSQGIKSYTFEGLRGNFDLSNLKNNPYFDKDIGVAKHLVRLVATSLAGLGMEKTWRIMSSAGLKKYVEPQNNPIFKFASDYSKNTVNSTVAKISSALADVPFEGGKALGQIPRIFTVENLLVGNLHATAMGRVKGAAENLANSGTSNKFLIRLSDRVLTASEKTVLDTVIMPLATSEATTKPN